MQSAGNRLPRCRSFAVSIVVGLAMPVLVSFGSPLVARAADVAPQADAAYRVVTRNGCWADVRPGTNVVAVTQCLPPLNAAVVGSTSTGSNAGLWMVASDGGVFSFGDAGFFGSTGAVRLNEPIVGMTATRSGSGYWLVAADGGVFSFGDAEFLGSAVPFHLPGVVTNLAPTPRGDGYWIASTGGGIATFGAAQFFGLHSADTGPRVAGVLPTPSGNGYWQFDFAGGVFAFGDAVFAGRADVTQSNDVVVGLSVGPASASGGGALRLISHAAALGRAAAVRPAGNTVTLTFDDGPNPQWTPQVLDVLDQYHVKAVFFVVGWEVSKYPRLAREIVRRGHVIANHSYSHPHLTKLDDVSVRRELLHTSDLIESTTGVHPECMRPPYGDTDARVVADAHHVGLQQILWNVNPEDYTKPGASVIASRIVAGARPGAILPLHDGGGNRSQTVAALPTIINGVRAKGLDFSLICG